MSRLILNYSMEAYDWLNGDLDAIDTLPLDLKADLLKDYEDWCNDLTSEAMFRFDGNTADWINLLFGEGRPEDDVFIKRMRDACWQLARDKIVEVIREDAQLHYESQVREDY